MLTIGGKKILLGISGSIAAYKSPQLVRLLIKKGAEVKVVLTPSAMDFVTPTTLSTLSKNPVNTSFTEIKDENDNPEWNNHVELSLWADFIIIAPATSNTISSMASARCDNLLLACYLSAKCPVFVAPSMDLDMYKHPGNQENLNKLKSFGNIILESESGDLASGLKGKGRMMEPKNIIKYINGEIEDVIIDDSIAKGIQDTEEANAYIEDALAWGGEYIALDSETTGLYPRNGYMLGISLSYNGEHGAYIDTECFDAVSYTHLTLPTKA